MPQTTGHRDSGSTATPPGRGPCDIAQGTQDARRRHTRRRHTRRRRRRCTRRVRGVECAERCQAPRLVSGGPHAELCRGRAGCAARSPLLPPPYRRASVHHRPVPLSPLPPSYALTPPPHPISPPPTPASHPTPLPLKHARPPTHPHRLLLASSCPHRHSPSNSPAVDPPPNSPSFAPCRTHPPAH